MSHCQSWPRGFHWSLFKWSISTHTLLGVLFNLLESSDSGTVDALRFEASPSPSIWKIIISICNLDQRCLCLPNCDTTLCTLEVSSTTLLDSLAVVILNSDGFDSLILGIERLKSSWKRKSINGRVRGRGNESNRSWKSWWSWGIGRIYNNIREKLRSWEVEKLRN